MLPSGKIDKYEYFTGENTFPSEQSRIKNKLSLHTFHLVKQMKEIEQQGKTYWRFRSFKTHCRKLTIKDAIAENTWTKEAKNELNKIKEIEKKIGREIFKKQFW